MEFVERKVMTFVRVANCPTVAARKSGVKIREGKIEKGKLQAAGLEMCVTGMWKPARA
jgi:hypothetical protein